MGKSIIFSCMSHNRPKVYEIRPSMEYRQPFRFDFEKPTCKDYQNEQITDYFNYGFNEMTMKGYINKLRMTVKAYNKSSTRTYLNNELELTRLNDEIPIDFGGFSNFYDPSLIQTQDMPGLASGSDELMDYFLQYHTLTAKDQMPLLSFVSAMYPKQIEQSDEVETLDGVIAQIQKNLEKKYDEIIRKNDQLKEISKHQTHYRNFNGRRGGDRGGDRGDRRDYGERDFGYRGYRQGDRVERDYRDDRGDRGGDRRRDRDNYEDRSRRDYKSRRDRKDNQESKDRKKDRSASRSRDRKKNRSQEKSSSRKHKQDKERSKKDHKKRNDRSRSRDSDRHKKKSRY